EKLGLSRPRRRLYRDDAQAGLFRCVSGDYLDLFLLGRHDALERRVAELVNAALNGDERRHRQTNPLKPSSFELALHAERIARDLERYGERDVRHPQPLGQDHANLAEALIVGLKTREHE